MFSLICTWINSWVNNGEAGDLRRHRARYDVIAMVYANTPGEKRQYDQHWESLLMVWSLYPPGTEEQAIMTSASCGMKQWESLTGTASIWSSSPSLGVAPESRFTPRHAWIQAVNKPMMTSSNGSIFRLLTLCAGNSPVPVNSPHKGQWRGALMFLFICAQINDWVNKREAGDLRRHRGHYDVIVMIEWKKLPTCPGTL